jgi:hypothetical protein
VVDAGRWLAAKGYLGAFGVDALLAGDHVYLTEINPRFQGSSALSAWLDGELRRPDLFLCHMAAWLGVEAPPGPPLRELVAAQPPAAQVVAHNTAGRPLHAALDPHPPESRYRFQLLPIPGTTVTPEAVLCKAVVPHGVTTDGMSVSAEVMHESLAFAASLFTDHPAEELIDACTQTKTA